MGCFPALLSGHKKTRRSGVTVGSSASAWGAPQAERIGMLLGIGSGASTSQILHHHTQNKLPVANLAHLRSCLFRRTAIRDLNINLDAATTAGRILIAYNLATGVGHHVLPAVCGIEDFRGAVLVDPVHLPG